VLVLVVERPACILPVEENAVMVLQWVPAGGGVPVRNNRKDFKAYRVSGDLQDSVRKL